MSNVKILAKNIPVNTKVYRCGDTKGKSCNLGGQLVIHAPCVSCIYKRQEVVNAGTLRANTVVVNISAEKN